MIQVFVKLDDSLKKLIVTIPERLSSLFFLQEALGDQPSNILHGAVDEVINTVKDDQMREKETEELLGSQVGSLSCLIKGVWLLN